MSEPTITQQIVTALSSVYEVVAKFNERFGGGLTEDLKTNGRKILGADPDDNNYVVPLEISTSGVLSLNGLQTLAHRIETPQIVINSLPSTLNNSHDGKIFFYDGVDGVAITLDSGIPTPDVETDARWNATIFNESLESTGIISVTAGEVEVNGGFEPFLIEPLEARIITRKSTGFQIQ